MKIVADIVNDVPLNNSTYGWVLRPSSEPFTGMDREIISSKASGMDGVDPVIATRGYGLIRLVVNTPQEHLETLEALFARPNLTLKASGTAGRSATGALVSGKPGRIYARGEYIDMEFIVQIHDGVWRGSTIESAPEALSTASYVLDGLLPGLGVEVQDALVRVKGAVTGLQVTDSAGSWFSYSGSLSSSQYLRFHSLSGRAWITTTDDWSGGTEVSGAIDYGGPRQVFEITPTFTTVPATRQGRLTITTASRSGASIQVRGRAALLV